jgi:hypothetical protein
MSPNSIARTTRPELPSPGARPRVAHGCTLGSNTLSQIYSHRKESEYFPTARSEPQEQHSVPCERSVRLRAQRGEPQLRRH